MIIEIDTEVLAELGVSLNEYLYLLLLSRKEIDSSLKLNVDLELLQTNGWIKIGEEDDVVLRDKSNSLFTTDSQSEFDKMWHGLLSRFPLKVINNGQVRMLRAKDPDSKANAKSKAKYKKVVGTSQKKHDRIIECLDRELDFRRRGNGLGYMQMLDTWINNHSWEKYSDTNDTTEPESNSGRITRSL